MRYCTVAFAVCIACAEGATLSEVPPASLGPDAAYVSPRDSHLVALDRRARFGLRIEALPPEGLFYTIVLGPNGSSEENCSAYGTGIDGDAELIEVHLGDIVPATYPLGSEANLIPGGRTVVATARLIQFRDGAHRSYPLTRGEVEVSLVPVASDPVPGQLNGRITVEVPHTLWGAPVCRHTARQLEDGGVGYIPLGCECTSKGGMNISCEDILTDAEVTRLSVEFEATYCGEMCRWSQALTENYCEDY